MRNCALGRDDVWRGRGLNGGRLQGWPQVRRPGATDWQDISWDDAINEIAARIKKTRDDSFIEKDAAGHTVNRLESVAFIGGCTDTNEFNYLAVKAMRALGVVRLENQARV